MPEELGEPPSFGPEVAVAERSFHLNGTAEINGREMDPERIDTVVRAGSVERWEVRADGTGHSFHLHDVQFRVLSVGGAEPPPELSGWKDTVFLPSSSRVSLLIRFSHHADAETPYMYHCHLLRHEDNGMMGQVLVTEDGEGPERIAGAHDHGG